MIAKENMLDQTLMNILEGKRPFSLANIFIKDTVDYSPPLEDLGVAVVIIAGINPKFCGELMKNFRYGIQVHLNTLLTTDMAVLTNPNIAFGVAVPNATKKKLR